MGLLAREADGVALDAEGTKHYPERQVHPLQDGALLDVELQVGRGVLELASGLVDRVEVDAVLGQGVGQGHAAAVLEVANVVRFQGACGGAGAEEAAPEAGALLVGPVNETQRNGTLLRGEGAHDLEGADHVQGAVEPASVGDGVYVAADEDGPLRVAGRRSPDVAGLIGLYLCYAFYLFQLAPEPLPGFLPLLCPRDAAGAFRTAGKVGEFLELIDGAAGVHPFGPH